MSRIFIAGTFVPFFSAPFLHLYSPRQVAALGVFGYATFSIIAGCLGDYRKPPNLVVMVTGIISIVQVSSPRPTPCLLPPGWCAQYNAITIVGGDNRIMSRSLNICEHEVIGLNIFSFSVSAVWGVLTIYRTFTDNSWQNLLHFHPLQVILQLLFIQDIARRRIASADQVSNFNEHVKPFLRYWYLFRIAQSQDGKL